jgi:hypothetical protein
MGYFPVGIATINDPTLVSGAGTYGSTAAQVQAAANQIGNLLGGSVAAARPAPSNYQSTVPQAPKSSGSSWLDIFNTAASTTNKIFDSRTASANASAANAMAAQSYGAGSGGMSPMVMVAIGGVALVGLFLLLKPRRAASVP